MCRRSYKKKKLRYPPFKNTLMSAHVFRAEISKFQVQQIFSTFGWHDYQINESRRKTFLFSGGWWCYALDETASSDSTLSNIILHSFGLPAIQKYEKKEVMVVETTKTKGYIFLRSVQFRSLILLCRTRNRCLFPRLLHIHSWDCIFSSLDCIHMSSNPSSSNNS